MPESLLFKITDASQVGEARRAAVQFAGQHGFDETDAGRAAIIATELCSNLVKHADGGQLILQSSGESSFDMLALDKGAGIKNIGDSLRDGHSTAGSRGEGLGAIQRLASRFEIFSAVRSGTVIWCRLALKPDFRKEPSNFTVGTVAASYPKELVCGDGWAVKSADGICRVLVVDGLGHGTEAAKASHTAVRIFKEQQGNPMPAEMLGLIHAGLRPTRGAAVAVANLDTSKNTVTFGGIGNISGVIVKDSSQRQMVSHAGIAGYEARKIAEFVYPWEPDSLLIMHSDGLQTRWNLSAYAGAQMRHPGLISGLLYRDFNRGTDDTTVLTVRSA